MARAHFIKTSRTEHICGHGRHVIPAGESYYWAAPGFRGAKQFRCSAHPFRESELTTSQRSEALAALEAFDDALDVLEDKDYDGLSAAAEELVSALDEYSSNRQAALDAWENGNEQLQEFADQAETAVSEANDIMDAIAPFDDEEPTREEWDDEDDYETAIREHQEAADSHWEEQVSAARDAAQSIEV